VSRETREDAFGDGELERAPFSQLDATDMRSASQHGVRGRATPPGLPARIVAGDRYVLARESVRHE
jgi:hypothetical protein